MDPVMQLAGPGLTAADAAVPVAPAPAQTKNTNASVNQAAFNQAQMQQLMADSDRSELRAAANDPAKMAEVTAMMQNPQFAVAAQRAAAAWVNPGLFGAFTGNASAAAPARQSIPVAQPVAETSSMGAQAQARKSHLNRMFLSKGRKVSDIQQRSPRLQWPAPSFLPSSQHTERATS